MPRSKVFLTIVLILLLVNAGFFLAWYGLGLRNWFKDMLASQLGKIVKGKISITELHFSDRQLLAEGLSYSSADSSIAVNVQRLRVQYNLLRFMISGFKVGKLLKDIDIVQPQVAINYVQTPKPPKPKKPLILPDIAPYFNNLRVRDGSVKLGLSLPLKIVNQGNLLVRDEFSNINIIATNKSGTSIILDAVSSRKGRLKAKGELEKGRIKFVDAELEALRPLFVQHPDIMNASTEISAVAHLYQRDRGEALEYKVSSQIWGTNLVFATRYPVQIPFLAAETDGSTLKAQISRSTVGSSSIEAEVSLSNMDSDLSFDSATAKGIADLGMISPELSGLVSFSANAEGKIKELKAQAEISSPFVAYDKYELYNTSVNAEYSDNVIAFSIPNSTFQNQQLSVSGDFAVNTRALSANIKTYPILASYKPYTANADIDVYVELLDKYPLVEAAINNVDFVSGDLSVNNVIGHIQLIPVSETKNYYLDAALVAANGYSISVVGDILDRNLLLDATFGDLDVASVYSQEVLDKMRPIVSGSLKAIMKGDNIYLQTRMDTQMQWPVNYSANLDALGSFNIRTMDATLHLDTQSGLLNNHELDLSVNAAMKDKQLYINAMRINDLLSLSGRLNLHDPKDLAFSMAMQDIKAWDIIKYYPDFDVSIPDFKSLNLVADYNRDNTRMLNAKLSLNELDLIAVVPLSINLSMGGKIDDVQIYGDINTDRRRIINLNGSASIADKIDLAMEAYFNELAIQDIVLDSPVTGNIEGIAGVALRDIGSKATEMDLLADLSASNINAGGFTIDTAKITAIQFPEKLEVDNLYARSEGLMELSGSGAIDFNVIKNEFFDGTNLLNLNVEGQLFSWLSSISSYIQESRGSSRLNCSVGVADDQFLIKTGIIDIRDGFIRLKDQGEALREITLKCAIDTNKLLIERGQVQMGEGKLIFSNVFEADNSDHFQLAMLDMGILRLMIEEPGIRANIPMFTPPRTYANITLKGHDSRYATVRGPFDQMKISAELMLSNANALFPPNTDNLLKLANTVREATAKRDDVQPASLPFTLDVMLILGDNISYVTYPTKLAIKSGGYLHLLYDGQDFVVKDANFSSERGTIDIFGTVFQVQNVDITMVEAQDVLSVNGIFYKRAPDGTMITLTATTSSDLTKSFVDRLEFNLSSDNPADVSISQILSRLRYDQNMDGTDGPRDIVLQDEALNLISGNLDSSIVTPFLSPLENAARRYLKLDNFSINAGFIQNLYTQYSTNPNQLAENTDMKQFTTDIAQFSSSILLNNLSISASKYLGRRLFLDYTLDLQEATDVQKKTKLMISHETSIRLMLPKQYRLGYTFAYLPQDKEFTHEIMLQRSFRFWGF